MGLTANVALQSALRQYDLLYTYLIPDEMVGLVMPGVRVEVPFGKSDRILEGIVVEIETGKEESHLKRICSVIDSESFLDGGMIELAGWMKKRYICTNFDALRCMLPPGVSGGKNPGKNERAAFTLLGNEEIETLIDDDKIRNIKHIRILELLTESEFVTISELKRMFSVSPGMLNTLKKHGYIDYMKVESIRNPFEDLEVEPCDDMEPTLEQRPVIEGLIRKLEKGGFSEALLHGVTGSGKTEVYMQLIRKCVDLGRQAVVLVPEIALTPHMTALFRGRFGDEVAVLHSRLSIGERYDQWKLIKNSKVSVVVGARSAIFAPFKDIGVIIVDEEHEPSYKSENNPKYHACEIAKFRAEQNGALLVYGSATPSVTTYYRAETGEIGLYKLNSRTNNMELPEVFLTDMRDELANGNRSVFSFKLQEEVRKNKDDGFQTILFLNKRGHSSFVMCRSCGLVLKCPRCTVSLTYHAFDNRMICHYCGYTAHKPEICPKCAGNYIRQFGSGTQRVEEDLKKMFPDISVIRMDMDTTTGKHSHREILDKFRNEKIDVLVGTQMIAKGHDFPAVTLVGVLAADSMLHTGEYNAGERAFQLITQVAGRAGRGPDAGRVVVQTYDTDNYCIRAAIKHDYESFYRQEIAIRKAMAYPPFTNIACATLSGVNDRAVFDRAAELCATLREKLPADGGSGAIGPARSPIAKIRGRYRWRIVIKFTDNSAINTLGEIADEFFKRDKKRNVSLSMDINPMNMI